MGLRAFSSQLLCEQVVGRGLRRTAYEVNEETGLYEPEYVNIFGVPFTFLPHESPEGRVAQPPKPKTCIEPDPEKAEFEIKWPNVIRINYSFRPQLELDLDKVDVLEIKISDTILTAELTQSIGGKPDLTKATQIELEKLARDQRMQRVVFETARNIFDQMKPNWSGNKEFLLAQVIRLVEKFVLSDKLVLSPPLFAQDALRRRLLITLNMNKVVQHIWDAISCADLLTDRGFVWLLRQVKPPESFFDRLDWLEDPENLSSAIAKAIGSGGSFAAGKSVLEKHGMALEPEDFEGEAIITISHHHITELAKEAGSFREFSALFTKEGPKIPTGMLTGRSAATNVIEILLEQGSLEEVFSAIDWLETPEDLSDILIHATACA